MSTGRELAAIAGGCQLTCSMTCGSPSALTVMLCRGTSSRWQRGRQTVWGSTAVSGTLTQAGRTGGAGAGTHRMVPGDGFVDARKADPAVADCIFGLRAAAADFMLAWPHDCAVASDRSQRWASSHARNSRDSFAARAVWAPSRAVRQTVPPVTGKHTHALPRGTINHPPSPALLPHRRKARTGSCWPTGLRFSGPT
jgi:hypothetical protein